jgi:hypothetical protein
MSKSRAAAIANASDSVEQGRQAQRLRPELEPKPQEQRLRQRRQPRAEASRRAQGWEEDQQLETEAAAQDRVVRR